MRRAPQGTDIFDWASAMWRATGALSMASVSEVAALLGARGAPPGASRGGATFEAVRQVASERLDGAGHEVFRLGEQLGRGLIDTAANLARQPVARFFDPSAALAAGRELAGRAFSRRAPSRPTAEPWAPEDQPHAASRPGGEHA